MLHMHTHGYRSWSAALDTAADPPSESIEQELARLRRRVQDVAARQSLPPPEVVHEELLTGLASWATPRPSTGSSRGTLSTPASSAPKPTSLQLSPADVAYGHALHEFITTPRFDAREYVPLEPADTPPPDEARSPVPRLSLAAVRRAEEDFDEQLEISLHIFESCQAGPSPALARATRAAALTRHLTSRPPLVRPTQV